MTSGPSLLHRGSKTDEDAIAVLRAEGMIREVLDTIESQAAELVRARRPAEKLSGEALAEAVRELVGDEPHVYGTWVFYPWSGRLVHVLPEEAFAELRTSRNRHKITTAEQAKLSGLAVGIVGLSVGQATALALVLEGIGGEMRLADHDTLALSNLNRLRAGVHEIGLNKATITARAIWEINPYAKLTLFDRGIRDENLEAFVAGLDLLFEECDDLAMKLRLREVARAHRVPVLMETSDRGMLDVERFDLEPDRPLLHGLVGDLNAASLRGLSTSEKVPFILAMIGEVSARAAASLVDIDATLETWPQLASAVSLGAAINTDTARRVALGSFTESGRFYVDLEQVIGGKDEPQTERAPPSQAVASRTTAAATIVAPPEIETIVRFASLAPSGGNAQPWRFVLRHPNVLECVLARERSGTMLDFEGRASHVALGAALENARLACVKLGLRATFERMPPNNAVWTLHLGGDGLARTPDDELLAAMVEQRVTNRRLDERRSLPDGLAEALVRTASDAGARLDVFEDARTMEALGELVARADRLRFLHPLLHREMMEEIRFTSEDARRTNDGIELATLELDAGETAGLQLLRSSEIVRTMRAMGTGEGLKKGTRKAVRAASALGILRIPGARDVRAYLRGGEAFQRVWLLANARGVAVQPMTPLLYLLARNEEGGEGLDATDRAELAALRVELEAIVGAMPAAEIMLARLSIAGPPTARSLRRPVAEILSAGQ